MSVTTKKIILLLAAVGLTLGVTEIFLRATGFGIITPEMNFGANTKMALDQGSFLHDKDLFWKLPSHRLDARLRAVQPDVAIPPKKDRRRILVLGDSCSRISQQLPPYSRLLEDSLQQHDLEVWNAAVPGYTVWQGRAWLHRQLLDMQPDVAVIYFGWNDHWRSTGIPDREYAARLSGSQPRLATLFKSIPNPPALRIAVDDYQKFLTDMVQALQNGGAEVVLIAGPSNLTRESERRLVQTHYLVAGDNAVILHRQYLAALQQVADDTHAKLLDAAQVFMDLKAPKKLLMRDGIHLTDLGHQVMASLLAGLIEPSFSDSPSPDTTELTTRAGLVLQRQGKNQ